MKEEGKLSREMIEKKNVEILGKIEEMNNICNALYSRYDADFYKYSNSISIIKENYIKMYDKVIETGEFDKFDEVEKTILNELDKLERNLKGPIFSNSENPTEALDERIRKINNFKDYSYPNYIDKIDIELEEVEKLKTLYTLYLPYLSEKDKEEYERVISVLKFNALYKKQIKQFVYGEEGENYLLKYSDEKEKEVFCQSLERIYNERIKPNADKKDKESKIKMQNPEKFMSSKDSITNLIVADINGNPDMYDYLIFAKIFNPHNCNIEDINWYTDTELWGFLNEDRFEIKKVFFSMLLAMLKITDDKEISIADCEDLYERFEFKCKPSNAEQRHKVIHRLYKSIGQTSNAKCYLRQLHFLKKHDEQYEDDRFCIIDFKYLAPNISFKKFQTLSESSSLEEVFTDSKNVKPVELPTKRSDTVSNLKDDFFAVGTPTRGIDGKYTIKTIEPLWYQFKHYLKEIGIHAYYYGEDFKLAVNLEDIKNLPIDESKVEIIPRETLREIIQKNKKDEYSR